MEEDRFKKAYDFDEEGYAEICRYCEHLDEEGYCVHPDLGEGECMDIGDGLGTCDAFYSERKRHRDEIMKEHRLLFR